MAPWSARVAKALDRDENSRVIVEHIDDVIRWISSRPSKATEALDNETNKLGLEPAMARARALVIVDRMMLQRRDPWQSLGVKRGTNKKEVRERYKRLMQVFHPDRGFADTDWLSDCTARLQRAHDAIRKAPATGVSPFGRRSRMGRRGQASPKPAWTPYAAPAQPITTPPEDEVSSTHSNDRVDAGVDLYKAAAEQQAADAQGQQPPGVTPGVWQIPRSAGEDTVEEEFENILDEEFEDGDSRKGVDSINFDEIDFTEEYTDGLEADVAADGHIYTQTSDTEVDSDEREGDGSLSEPVAYDRARRGAGHRDLDASESDTDTDTDYEYDELDEELDAEEEARFFEERLDVGHVPASTEGAGDSIADREQDEFLDAELDLAEVEVSTIDEFEQPLETMLSGPTTQYSFSDPISTFGPDEVATASKKKERDRREQQRRAQEVAEREEEERRRQKAADERVRARLVAEAEERADKADAQERQNAEQRKIDAKEQAKQERFDAKILKAQEKQAKAERTRVARAEQKAFLLKQKVERKRLKELDKQRKLEQKHARLERERREAEQAEEQRQAQAQAEREQERADAERRHEEEVRANADHSTRAIRERRRLVEKERKRSEAERQRVVSEDTLSAELRPQDGFLKRNGSTARERKVVAREKRSSRDAINRPRSIEANPAHEDHQSGQRRSRQHALRDTGPMQHEITALSGEPDLHDEISPHDQFEPKEQPASAVKRAERKAERTRKINEVDEEVSEQQAHAHAILTSSRELERRRRRASAARLRGSTSTSKRAPGTATAKADRRAANDDTVRGLPAGSGRVAVAAGIVIALVAGSTWFLRDRSESPIADSKTDADIIARAPAVVEVTQPETSVVADSKDPAQEPVQPPTDVKVDRTAASNDTATDSTSVSKRATPLSITTTLEGTSTKDTNTTPEQAVAGNVTPPESSTSTESTNTAGSVASGEKTATDASGNDESREVIAINQPAMDRTPTTVAAKIQQPEPVTTAAAKLADAAVQGINVSDDAETNVRYIIEELRRLYVAGDAKGLTQLFAKDAHFNDDNGIENILATHEALFDRTNRRHVSLKINSIEDNTDSYAARGRFSIALRYKDGKSNLSDSSMRVKVVKSGDQYLIQSLVY